MSLLLVSSSRGQMKSGVISLVPLINHILHIVADARSSVEDAPRRVHVAALRSETQRQRFLNK